MPILNPERFKSGGPYVAWCDLPAPLVLGEGEWPEYERYAEGLFFAMADDLMGLICKATRTYLPFDQYELTQLRKPHEIFALSSALLFLSGRCHEIAAAKRCLTLAGF